MRRGWRRVRSLQTVKLDGVADGVVDGEGDREGDCDGRRTKLVGWIPADRDDRRRKVGYRA